MNEGVALFAAFTAFCAVVLAPLVSWWTAKRQANVAVLSSNRQAWINNLRDTCAEYISTAHVLSLVRDDELHGKYERMLFLEAKINLSLNPLEIDHQQVCALVSKSMDAAARTLPKRTSENVAELRGMLEELVRLVQRVLKREWERVKKVE
jgi:hypothetical protein